MASVAVQLRNTTAAAYEEVRRLVGESDGLSESSNSTPSAQSSSAYDEILFSDDTSMAEDTDDDILPKEESCLYSCT